MNRARKILEDSDNKVRELATRKIKWGYKWGIVFGLATIINLLCVWVLPPEANTVRGCLMFFAGYNAAFCAVRLRTAIGWTHTKKTWPNL